MCDSSGNLYAGGGFETAGGVSAKRIAEWNGTTWSALESGMNNIVYVLAFDSSGNLYAGGDFSNAGGIPSSRIAKWEIPLLVKLSSFTVMPLSGRTFY